MAKNSVATEWLFAVLLVIGVIGAVGAIGARGALAADDDIRGLRSADRAERITALRAVVAADAAALKPRVTSLRGTLRALLTQDKDAEVRALSAAAWLHLEGDAAVKPVIDAMRAERDPVAEAALAAVWRGVSGDVARRALAAAARDATDLRLGALAAEALGYFGPEADAAGRDDLEAILGAAPAWPVVSGACLGLGQMRGPRTVLVRSIELLLRHLRHPDASVRSCAAAALTTLTGRSDRDTGSAPGPWEEWWAKARETWQPAGGGVPRAPTETTDVVATRSRRTWSRFFGVEVKGDRVAFVIDYSQSMWGDRRARAESELIDAVKGMPPAAFVSVVLFNDREWWWHDDPVPARPQEVLDLVRYLPEQETKSYTNIYDSLEAALTLAGVGAKARKPAPGLDEVFLLSDGVPNRGKIQNEDRIVEAILALSAGRVRISTVSLGPPVTKLLERLAVGGGGTYVSEPIAK